MKRTFFEEVCNKFGDIRQTSRGRERQGNLWIKRVGMVRCQEISHVKLFLSNKFYLPVLS